MVSKAPTFCPVSCLNSLFALSKSWKPLTIAPIRTTGSVKLFFKFPKADLTPTPSTCNLLTSLFERTASSAKASISLETLSNLKPLPASPKNELKSFNELPAIPNFSLI